MTKRQMTKLVHEGRYVAEVDVELLIPEDAATEGGWSPYLSLEDAYRLDDVRLALRHGWRASTALHRLLPDPGPSAPSRRCHSSPLTHSH